MTNNQARKELLNLIREIDAFETDAAAFTRKAQMFSNLLYGRPYRDEMAAIYAQVEVYEQQLYDAFMDADVAGVRRSTMRRYVERFDGVKARQAYQNTLNLYVREG